MIVRESISFERYRDPKKALGLKLEPEIIDTSNPNSIINFIFLDKPYNLVNMGINGSNKWSVYLHRPDKKYNDYITIGDIRVDDMEERIELAKKIIFDYGMGLKEYGETNIPSLDPKENAYKKIHGQQYIMDSTEDSDEDDEEDDVDEAISFQRYKDPKTALGLDPFEEIVDEIKRRLKNVGIELQDIYYDFKTKVIEINLKDYHHIAKEDAKDVIKGSYKICGEKVFFNNVFRPSFIKIDLKDAKKMYETTGFQKYRDPKEALGLGRRAVIEEWCKTYLADYTINDDFTIDAGYVALEHTVEGDSLPEFIKFNKTDSFYIGYNNLTTLRGCPKEVKNDFSCSQNKLTSLKFSPEKVGGKFHCSGNSKHFTVKNVLQYCNVKETSIIN